MSKLDLKVLYLALIPTINDYIDIISNEIIHRVDRYEFIFRFDPNTLMIILDINDIQENKLYTNVDEFDKSYEDCSEYKEYYNL
jgi:hypothetical protein